MKNPFLNTDDYAISKQLKRITNKKQLAKRINSSSKTSFHHLSSPIFVSPISLHSHTKTSQIYNKNYHHQYQLNNKQFVINPSNINIKLYEVQQLQYQPHKTNNIIKLPIKNITPSKITQQTSVNIQFDSFTLNNNTNNDNATSMDTSQQSSFNSNFNTQIKEHINQQIKQYDKNEENSKPIENDKLSNKNSICQKSIVNQFPSQQEVTKKCVYTSTSQIQQPRCPSDSCTSISLLSLTHSSSQLPNYSFSKIVSKSPQTNPNSLTLLPNSPHANHQHPTNIKQPNNIKQHQQPTINKIQPLKNIPYLINVRNQIFYLNLMERQTNHHRF